MAEKAKIIVLDKNGQKVDEIPVMFNPREYSISTAAQISNKGKGSGLQFQQVDTEDLTIPLFFDTYETQSDVRVKTQKIAGLVMPTVSGKETKQPPICLFSWGGFGYKGIIYKVDQKFTMFLASGIPVRAELTVTFKSVVTKEEDALFRGKEACRKLWPVKSGDRLDLIAYRALNDPSQWRRIAEANNIVDPLTFPTHDDIGKILIIPD